jgi:CheY-like chemotaxis protein
LFVANPKILQRLAAKIQRVLVVDPNAATVRLIADQLRHLGAVQMFNAATVEKGYALARAVEPQLIFVESAAGGADGIAFARKLRRGELDCREAPIIMCTADAKAETIFGARDAGVHEFMRKPFTMGDLERRLEAVILKPRGWIEAIQYVGPDRRRFNSADYAGPRKRKADSALSPVARLSQALRIVRSAATALDSDPVQARRALAAQALELKKIGAQLKEPRLALAAQALDGCVRSQTDGPAARADLLKRMDALLGFMPPDDERAA